MANTPWLASVRAEEDATCILIPNDIFVAVIESQPELSVRLYRDACIRHLLAHQTRPPDQTDSTLKRSDFGTKAAQHALTVITRQVRLRYPGFALNGKSS